MAEPWRLPRSTSNLHGDWVAALRAYQDATTDAQRAAVAVRFTALRDRQRVVDVARVGRLREQLAALGRVGRDVCVQLGHLRQGIAAASAASNHNISRIMEGMARASSSWSSTGAGRIQGADLGGEHRLPGVEGA